MSKSDEIRRMRELQHEQRERDAANKDKAHHVVPPRPSAEAPRPAEAPPAAEAEHEVAPGAGANADEQGRCSGCGKVRALVSGLVAVHQKGLGKICPGSRKAPA